MFGTIQELALVIGILGLLAGIVIVIFQRRIGRMTLMIAGGMIIRISLIPYLVLHNIVLTFFKRTFFSDSGILSTSLAAITGKNHLLMFSTEVSVILI